MSIPELLSPNRIRHALTVAGKPELLRYMADLLGAGGGVTASVALASLQEREDLGSTGLGNGFALPHGRLPGLARPIGAFAQMAGGVDYAAIDRQPVRLVFALLVPAEATEGHLQILAGLARMFHDQNLRECLIRAKSPEELYNHLMTPGTA
jgi:nitrogen PTS system EIIA component